ncbi:RHS repeat-associated core domain-containing protein [Andreprevotia lacus DSM 23236]|uniref:RHS repeat-associated core domain-containing protein n=2 Tax=Andreprevotia TaxID=397275 RepID=A0A1W1WZS3_9NEIS|nr:RHS repeat-associated core domain-containing protein [Andreprevotia lacus DSM 23236]
MMGQSGHAAEATGYGETLNRLDDAIAAKAGERGTGQGKLQQRIDQLQQQLQRAAERQEAAFAATEQLLTQRKLPAELLERHRAAVAQFRAQHAQFAARLQALQASKDDASRRAGLQALHDELRQWRGQSGSSRTGDWGASQPQRTPAESPAAFKRQLSRFGIAPLRLAGALPAGTTLPDFPALPALPTVADTAATDEAPQTAEIKALAAQLGNNPVQIHNWVRNQIDYVPSYGIVQGAAQTLRAGRGNAADTAALELALLRAAGIAARYTYGTIEVPIAQAQRWLNVNSSSAVITLLQQGGVPYRTVESGGQVSAIRMEHVWLQAYVDYVPSRGAVNRKPNTWVPLDASFKPIDSKAGLDLKASFGFSGRAVLDAMQAGATCTAELAGKLSATALQGAYADFGTRLNAYAAQLGSDATVQDLLGQRSIHADTPAILYGTLPYTTVAEAGRFTTMPDTLKWNLHLALYSNAANRAAGQPLFRLDAPLASNAGQRISLGFVPATQADADAITALMPTTGNPVDYPASLPAYLIKVKAELRVDGQLMASGGTFTLGDSLLLDTGLDVAASGSQPAQTRSLRAGETVAVVVDGQGLGQGDLTQLAQRRASLGTDRASGSAELLHQIGRLYFANADALGRYTQRAGQTVAYRLPSLALISLQGQADSAYGVITQLRYSGIGIDLPIQSLQTTSLQGTAANDFLRQSWLSHSALTTRVLSQVLGTPDQAYSAVSVPGLFALANASQNAHLYTSSNIAGLSSLALDSASQADIVAAVQQGRRVLSTETLAGDTLWKDNAYVSEDPLTLTSNYTLAATSNQSFFAASGGLSWLAWGRDNAVAPLLKARLDKAAALQAHLAGLLPDQDGTRWNVHPAKAEVTGGLFLSGLSQQAGSTPCDWLALQLAGQLTAGSGDTGTAGANHAPLIQSQPVIAGQGGRSYRYQVVASDADGDTLSYRLINAPGGMALSAAGLLAWDKTVVGSYPVILRVDDGKTYAEQAYTLTIGADALPLDVGLGFAPSILNVGEQTLITASTTGGSGNAQLTLTINGAPVTLDSKGQLQWQAPASGAYIVVATAKDGQDTISKTSVISVRDPAGIAAPVVNIASPTESSLITVPTAITGTGTVTDSALAYYQILLKPSDAPDSAWREIGRGYSPVSNGKLGTLDPTGLPNGWYKLGVIGYDVNGQQTSQVISVEIAGDVKIGQFSLSFVDLDIDALGIPVRVTRSYDTRRKSEALDFGYGWSVDYQNMQVRSNVVLGKGWTLSKATGSLQICANQDGPHRISVSIPGLPLQRFDAKLEQPCGLVQPPPVKIVLTPLPGTTTQLEVITGNVLAQGNQLTDMDSENPNLPWNPSDFKLTTQDGLIYTLRSGVGIMRVTDPYGNTLDYTTNGLIHSTGLKIAFDRDSQGRISAITDPAGKRITYGYNASGDLTSVTDQLKQITKLSYNRSHGLVDYTDPRGIRAVRYEYDDNGRLIATIDANGQRTEATHDDANQKEVITDRRGYTTTYVYDANGNVTSKTDALGYTTLYTYDALGNEATVTDPLGHITRKDYDPITRAVTKYTDANGYVTQYVPDEKGNIKESTDPLGRKSTTKWFAGVPVIVTKSDGRVATLGYGADGSLRSLGLPGQTLRYDYNGLGQKTAEYDAASIKTEITLDTNGKETGRRTYAKDGTTVLANSTTDLDDAGRIIKSTDPLNRSTSYSYNSANKVVQETDPAGRIKRYEYDALARLTKTTYPDGTSDLQSYDVLGNVISRTDRAGRVTRMDYDALNRLSTTTYPDGSTEQQHYDAAGRLSDTVDRNGKATTYEYDPAGNQTALIDPLGRRFETTYDAVGRRKTSKDPDGRITTYEYNDADQLIKTIYPDQSFSKTDWRPDSLKNSDTDAKGNVTNYGYDAALHLNQVTQTDASGQLLTQYGYDELGRKTSQTDARQHTTTWGYDAAGQLKRRTLPDGQFESWEYDNLGRQITHTDFNGKTTTWTYDNADRIASRLDGDNKASFYSYTASGQLASVKDARGETRWQYDASDRPTQQSNPDGSTLSWSYDNAGQIATRSTAAGTVRYSYDANGKLTSITAPDGSTTTQGWDNNGLLSSITRPNGTKTVYMRDVNGRLTQIVHQKGTTVLGGTTYQLDVDGKRLGRNDYDQQSTLGNDGKLANPARSIGYQYDSLNRLTQEKVSDLRTPSRNRTTDYTYDAVGNRKTQTLTTTGGTTSKAYDYDERDRLKTITTNGTSVTTYSWDNNGNLLQKTALGSVTKYGWDARNRLTQVQQGKDAQHLTTIAAYQYDDNGNRVSKTDKDGKTTSYLIDELFAYAQAVQETCNGQSTNYVYGDQLLQQSKAGQSSYYEADGLGSTQQLTDASGSVTAEYEYSAFGEPQTLATQSSGYLYTGEYRDQDTGLQYNRARWYDADVGRFLSQDSFDGHERLPITLNKYNYGNANSVNFVDPSGFDAGGLPGIMTTMGTNEELRAAQLNYQMVVAQTFAKLEMVVLLTSVGFTAVDQAVQTRLKDCIEATRAGKNLCKSDWYVFNVGYNHKDVAAHVAYAISSNQSPSWLSRRDPAPEDRPWIRPYIGGLDKPCQKYAGDCDEYPFNASLEGWTKGITGQIGEGGISLRTVPSFENRSAGSYLRWWYSDCSVPANNPGKKYKVTTIIGLPTGGLCKR